MFLLFLLGMMLGGCVFLRVVLFVLLLLFFLSVMLGVFLFLG